MTFKFTVVDVDEKKIAGIHIKTNMEKASTDARALWEKFMPIMHTELGNHSSVIQGSPTYGVSEFIDENQFIYWTTVQVNEIENLPAGLQTKIIPAGLYVKCTAPSLEQLGAAFMALHTWINEQDRYTYNMQGVAFELYKHQWKMTDSIDIYAAVLEK